VFAPNVPITDIPALLRPLFETFRSDRTPGEGFGDWTERVGFDALRQAAAAGRAQGALLDLDEKTA
jgi:sulfite reductase beta subunit-like hemoprotein